jgi:hypothetical protein
MRFTEYVTRFVRLASRYEEEVTGATKFGYPSLPFSEGTVNRPPQLGSGIVFSDEATRMRELSANANRIEAWRRTKSYQYYIIVCSFPLLQMILYKRTLGRISTSSSLQMPSKDLMFSISSSACVTLKKCLILKPL